MTGIQLRTTAPKDAPLDPLLEVERLAALLAVRGAELAGLQGELRDFKARYARIVGGLLGELAEIEREVRRAESRLAGLDETVDEETDAPDFYELTPRAATGRTGLRNLFWSVARMFHPDHAADEDEARRRHSIMAEASRAYRDGDVESLSTLLGDEQLQSYCATASRDEGAHEDINTRLVSLKEELITVEFGIKRIKQDRLYQLMLSAEDEARKGRDALAQMAGGITRKIAKARNRLAHLS